MFHINHHNAITNNHLGDILNNKCYLFQRIDNDKIETSYIKIKPY